MSFTTFESVDKSNQKLIRKPLEGLVFVKRWAEGDAPITQVYTTEGGLIIPAGYEHVGLTDKKAGAKWGRDVATSDVESWGKGEPTRRDITKDVTTLQVTMQESKRITMELHNNTDLSGVKADAAGNIVVDKPRRPQPLDWRAFVLSKDGDGADAIYWLDWLPNCQVTGMEDVTYSEEDALVRTVTFTGYEDPQVRTAHRQVWGGPGVDAVDMGFPPNA